MVFYFPKPLIMKRIVLFIALIIISCKLSAQKSDSVSVSNSDTTITPIERIESPPSFPGGKQGFDEYISKNLKISKFDLDHVNTGINFVRFIVEKDGSLSHLQPLRMCSPDAEKESIRLLKESPKWVPAMSGGKPCRVYFTVPIRYKPS